MEIKSNEITKIELDINIEGSDTNDIVPTFFISFNDRLYGFEGKFKEGTVYITIPSLNIGRGTYPAYLQIIVDGKFLTKPWSGTIEIVEPDEITVEDLSDISTEIFDVDNKTRLKKEIKDEIIKSLITELNVTVKKDLNKELKTILNNELIKFKENNEKPNLDKIKLQLLKELIIKSQKKESTNR